MESESTEDVFESPSAEEHNDEFEDVHSTPGGVNSVKDHISKDKTTFIMYCSRIFEIVFAVGYLLPVLMPARLAYVAALLAALLTSLLRLRQRLPPVELSRQWAARLAHEDAAHYVLFALVFVVPPPLTLVLVPVTLFAALHSSSYTLQLLDLLGPGSAAPLRYLISLMELQSQRLLRVIALAEIALLPYSVVALLTGRGGLLVPFVYYRFLTLRYASRRNPYSRAVFAELRATLEGWAASQRCPAALAAAVRRGVTLVAALAPPLPPGLQ